MDEKIVFCKGGGCTAKLGPGALAHVLEKLPLETYRGFSPLFAVLAVFDLLGALVIWTVLQNKPAIEVAQETHNDPAPQH